MRTHHLGTITAAALLAALSMGLLAGCGHEPRSEPRASQQVRTQPEVRVFALLDRAALRPVGLRDRVVELTGASTLDGFVPAKAFPDDRLPELPALPDGARRFAAITSGCQEQDPPSIRRVDGAWQLHFDDNGTRCVVADHYVVVWDVAARGG